jgi:hypothetical protein
MKKNRAAGGRFSGKTGLRAGFCGAVPGPAARKKKKNRGSKRLSDSGVRKNSEKKRKKILAVWKEVVSLHPLSTGKRTATDGLVEEAQEH